MAFGLTLGQSGLAASHRFARYKEAEFIIARRRDKSNRGGLDSMLGRGRVISHRLWTAESLRGY